MASTEMTTVTFTAVSPPGGGIYGSASVNGRVHQDETVTMPKAMWRAARTPKARQEVICRMKGWTQFGWVVIVKRT